jgi:putative spermidine/putrescine transport system ATP-binding protein
VRCHDLTVRVENVLILDHLNLQVGAGQVCAVVGESGSGKTTLLRTIAGFVTPETGAVEIDGVLVTDRSPNDRGVTLLFQEPRLFPALSVSENVAFAMRVRGAGSAERRDVALALLSEVGLIDRCDDSIDGLSGGEQQRVALARALCVPPKVLLLDEPFNAVDAPRRRELRRLVGDLLARHRITTIFVTHDVTDVERLADSVAVLVDGRVAQHDLVATVLANPANQQVRDLVTTEA